MTWKNCRACEHVCKCCANKEFNYVSECDLCVAHDKFKPFAHINYCPDNGLPLTAPKAINPVVVIEPLKPTREEMQKAMKRFIESKGEYRL